MAKHGVRYQEHEEYIQDEGRRQQDLLDKDIQVCEAFVNIVCMHALFHMMRRCVHDGVVSCALAMALDIKEGVDLATVSLNVHRYLSHTKSRNATVQPNLSWSSLKAVPSSLTISIYFRPRTPSLQRHVTGDCGAVPSNNDPFSPLIFSQSAKPCISKLSTSVESIEPDTSPRTPMHAI